MMKDGQGLAVTGASASSVAAIDRFTYGLTSYQQGAASILEAAEQEPECISSNIYAAMLSLAGEDRPGFERAGKIAQNLKSKRAFGNKREVMLMEAIDSWLDERIDETALRMEQIVEAFPRDLATMKLAQYHYFNLGDMPGLLRTALHARDANRDNAHFWGNLAFGYEQCHLIDDAEKAAHKGIELNRNEPWSHHSLAHVYETRGEVERGIAFMESMSDCWEGLVSSMHTHNWWHLALYYLDEDRHQDALNVFDQHVWACDRTCSQDQINAVALLARLELRGVDVGDRWKSVARHLSERLSEHVIAFNDMHFIYAFGRVEPVRGFEMIESMRLYAAETSPCLARIWKEVAIPAAQGMLAHAAGDFASTVKWLRPVINRMVEMGGSHAQRDLFEQIWIDALIKTGTYGDAQQLLEMRKQWRTHIPVTHRMLAVVYDGLDLTEQASESRRLAAKFGRPVVQNAA